MAAPVSNESASGSVNRHFHVPGVRAVTVGAKDDGAFEAHLRPARAAMLTAAATGVVVIHHALAAAGFLGRNSCADSDYDAAGLVARDHRLGAAFESGASIAGLEGGAVNVQVAAAHTRCLYLEHRVAGARRGVGKVTQLKLPVTDKHIAFHAILPTAFFSRRRRCGVRQARQLTTARR